MQRNRGTWTIDCLGHVHEQNSDFQEALFVVGDIEHGTNYGHKLTRIKDLAEVFHHATGGRGRRAG